MKAKRTPSESELAMLDAMSDPDAWNAWVKSQGFRPDPDLPVCLATVPQDQWEDNVKVMTTPATLSTLRRGSEARLITAMIKQRLFYFNYYAAQD